MCYLYLHGVNEYKDEDFLMLSGIQHFAFCPRQWALIHIENQWSENFFTATGNLIHENAHDSFFNEKRRDTIISRGMAVHSVKLGLSGECDIVEFTQSADGTYLSGREGLWRVCPVEYKRGEPKDDDCDRLQLTAQVLCLEEMLACDISEACLYYDKIRRRERVCITEELRRKTAEIAGMMHKYYNAGYTPRVRKAPRCRSCSLSDVCLPALNSCTSVSDYIQSHLGGEENI